MNWHIITGEYPPQPGGVSDYTKLIAGGLVDIGDSATIWAPPIARTQGETDAAEAGISVHRLPDRFGWRSRQIIAGHLDALQQPQRILVQYVPQAFGRRGANVPFCYWLASRRRDSLWVMFHEVAYPFGGTLAQNGLAAINRLMAALVLHRAARAFVSIQTWQGWVQSLAGTSTRVSWLPVPSSIPPANANGKVAPIRAHFSGGRPLVGHFGTYGGHVQPLLEASLPGLLTSSNCAVLLLGRDSDRASRELIRANPQFADRIGASGSLSAEDLSAHISACDLMLQPYPDGVSTRRTSSMAALAHGRPLVTTDGALTEPVWRETGAARLVPVNDSDRLAAEARDVLENPAAREALAVRGKQVYDERFDLRHTIAALRGAE